jgi:hypothetical protein
MRAPLVIHPASQRRPAIVIEVSAQRADASTLALSYTVCGDLDALLLPSPAPPERADELWRHTCFEAFVTGEDSAYYEFNFSPSSQWAAYTFVSYRDGMSRLDAPAPSIAVSRTHEALTLHARVALPTKAGARAGLSCVIEEKSGAVSYWALAHTGDKPDFHRSDSFVLNLNDVDLA